MNNLKPKYIGKPLELADEGILSRLTLWPIATHITWTKDGATPENLYFTDGKDKSSFGGSGTIRLKIAKKHGLYLLTGMDSQLGGVWRTHKVFDAILHNTDIINSINEN